MTQYNVEFEMLGLPCKPNLTVNICSFLADSDDAAIWRTANIVSETDVLVDVVRLKTGCGALVWESRLAGR